MSPDSLRPGRFVPAEQQPPEPKRITDQVVMRFEHVFEVDPALMQDVGQKPMPAWDTHRIVSARWAHLDAVHNEFADGVTLAGAGPDEGLPEDQSDLAPGSEQS